MQTSTLEKPKNFFLAAAPLFLVLFIDSMGLGLVFPILNALIVDPNAHFIAADISPRMRDILFGFTIGIFMFCWFFGAAFLGDLSDQIGRKKSLMICLVGAFFGYLLSAIGVLLGSYALLLVGRMIAGFTAGSQAIAQAAIVDLSLPEHKARNVGLILFFCSLGFIVGPMIGGILSDNQLLSWFNYAMPLYFAAVVSLINAGLLAKLFHETFTHVQKIQLKLHHAINIFLSAFKNEKVRGLSIVLLMEVFGWSGFYSFISMYLLHTYQFTSLKTGFYMGVMGIGFGIGTGFLVEPLTKRFSLSQLVTAGCMLSAAMIALTLTAPKEWYVWFYVVIIAASSAVVYSVLITLFSNQVDEDSQGWVMGITGSIMAFSFGLNGLLIGIFAGYGVALPLWLAVGCLLATAFLMRVVKVNNNQATAKGHSA